MNIIMEKKGMWRMADGINAILAFTDEEFDEFIRRFTPYNNEKGKQVLEEIRFFYTSDPCELPKNEIQLGIEKRNDENGNIITRGYYGAESYSIIEILCNIKDMLDFSNSPPEKAGRLQRILEARDLESFKNYWANKKEIDREVIDKLFEILQSEEAMQRFIDFDNNTEFFSVKGQKVDKKVYAQNLADIFGKINDFGKLEGKTTLYKEFYLPNKREYESRYKKVYDECHLIRYADSEYQFDTWEIQGIYTECIRTKDEPEWAVNPELYEKVYEGMPSDLSVEEKAMYIYCKLCKLLNYDEGYFYRDRLPEDRYKNEFSKEKLEAIVPGSKITCFEFSRIFAKIVNDMDEDIEAVVLNQGINNGHALIGFYTDNISVTLEGVNAKSGNADDMVKAKNNLELEGLGIISDGKGIARKALDKAYRLAIGTSRSIGDLRCITKKSTSSLGEELRATPREEIQYNTSGKLIAFVQMLKQKGIIGAEATQTLLLFDELGFFGPDKMKKVFLGKKVLINEREEYRRVICMKSGAIGYLLDTDTMQICPVQKKYVQEKIDNGEYVYEDEKHTLDKLEGK